MVKPLVFKGDKKPKSKKRKRTEADAHDVDDAKHLGEAIADPDADVEKDDSWVSADAVSDVNGPVMFVLPTSPPSALAYDPSGKVFAMPIENIVDGNPLSAEPHDTRQVWIANKIVGTENFRFKGKFGKYLGCDESGILSATTQAVSAPETWLLPPAPDEIGGKLQLQTLSGKLVAAHDPPSSRPNAQPEVRGDVDESSSATVLRVRMQARFKPRIRESKAEKDREKITRFELEKAVGRRLDDDEAKRLKRAKREGDYHHQLLLMRVKTKHDKYG